MRAVAIVALAALCTASCGSDESTDAVTGVNPAPPGEPHARLSTWGLFADRASLSPAEGVERYDVISPLFSDYTAKRRFVWLPDGTSIDYSADSQWGFPVGTIFVKSFSYLHDMRDPGQGEQLLEVRLLVHDPDGWDAHTYLWDDATADGVREVAGEIIASSWLDEQGQTRTNDYIVPNTNECQECHGEKPALGLLGPRTRQLDRAGPGGDNQLERFASLGWLQGVPPAGERERLVDPFGDAPLSDRVRSYLDANCGHCHTEGGPASQSALLLSWSLTDPDDDDEANWGVCKTPTSAGGATCGHTFDIVPGDPDSSIYLCRLTSTDPEVRMPPLVSRLPHDEGVALIRAWIEQMPARTCGG